MVGAESVGWVDCAFMVGLTSMCWYAWYLNKTPRRPSN